MTWGEFNTQLLTFIDVDGTRRGATTLRTAFSKAAVRDLANYIPGYAEYVAAATFVDAEETPFDALTAEAAAEFVKSKLIRNVEKDPGMAQMHWAAYLGLRQRLHLKIKAEEETVKTVVVGPANGITIEFSAGQTVPFYLTVEKNEAGTVITTLDGYSLEFSVYRHSCQPTRTDPLLRYTSDEGDRIAVTGNLATWVIPMADSATMLLGNCYPWEVRIFKVGLDVSTIVQQGFLVPTSILNQHCHG